MLIFSYYNDLTLLTVSIYFLDTAIKFWEAKQTLRSKRSHHILCIQYSPHQVLSPETTFHHSHFCTSNVLVTKYLQQAE